MQRNLIILFFLTVSQTVLAQEKLTLKNKSALLDSLNNYYTSFLLDGKETHKKEISISLRPPTKPKNDVTLSDSIVVISIIHSNGNKLSGTIVIEIDPIKGFYMFSSRYHESKNGEHQGFESRTLGWWEMINKSAPNYVYSPKKISMMIK